jgi:hypothetical protein
MGLFMTWLRYVPPDAGKAVVRGPGAMPVRSEGRVNRILTAVRGFLMHAVAAKQAPGWVVGQLYEIADGRDLPWEAGGKDGGLVYRLKALTGCRSRMTPLTGRRMRRSWRCSGPAIPLVTGSSCCSWHGRGCAGNRAKPSRSSARPDAAGGRTSQGELPGDWHSAGKKPARARSWSVTARPLSASPAMT